MCWFHLHDDNEAVLADAGLQHACDLRVADLQSRNTKQRQDSGLMSARGWYRACEVAIFRANAYPDHGGARCGSNNHASARGTEVRAAGETGRVTRSGMRGRGRLQSRSPKQDLVTAAAQTALDARIVHCERLSTAKTATK
jgi:hypothetical protein